ncbi:MAG TPA: YfhO family protein [Gemmatimonadales bacterium]|nr:YfhO family protein [Gemmatimonadales bacterium]
MVWIAILCLPMLAGKWLAGPLSDQLSAGVPFRGWGAEWWRRLGHVPLWNPEIFGGMPYIGAIGTGDVLYPSAVVLRLLLPTSTAINIGFFIHYVLAGLFTYLLLRSLRVSWSGAVVAGVAYQLSGIMASYVQPGHDGKLVVSALTPLVLLGLVLGMRDRRSAGYAIVGVGIGLSIFTQHVQITYYMLLTAGLFALYLAFGERMPTGDRVRRLALALGAVLLGFGIAAIQLLPAFAHMPLSARAVSVQGGFEGATSYAIPWEHVGEFFLKNFVGQTGAGTYWGTNPIKLHSEYLGLPVIALAVFGAGAAVDRRLRWWLAGIGALFFLICLGSATPFYRLWWAVMPYVKQMRAPGMAFFVVALVVACFAGFGTERLERQMDNRGSVHVRAWMVVAAALALLAVAGVFGSMARSLTIGRASSVSTRDILIGALTSALALGVVAAIAWAALRKRLRAPLWPVLLALLIGADLWLNARPFWTYSDLDKTLYQSDPIVDRIRAGPQPTRVLDLASVMRQPAYPGNVLMALDVPQLLGEHGLELRYFGDVLGGHNVWRNLGNLHLWEMFAIHWVIAPAVAPGQGLDSIPGFTRVLQRVPTSSGSPADLYERKTPSPYAVVAPAAFSLDSASIIAALTDPRMAFDRVVLLDTREGVATPPLAQLPVPSAGRAVVEQWEPGRMAIGLNPAPPNSGYLVVSENWSPDWRAKVDGNSVKVLRGNWTLITVPVPAGAKRVELAFSSPSYRRGEFLTLLSLIVVLGAVVGPTVTRRLRRG